MAPRLESSRLLGLPPAGAASPRILVLGSFPSSSSLARAEYYGNERNHFWTIAGALCGFDSAAAYADRVAAMARSGLALWDVIAACEREGSMDGSIRDETPNPLLEYLAAKPSIERIALNGAKAASSFAALVAPEFGRRALAMGAIAEWRPASMPRRSIHVCRLPSTSPIPTRGFLRAEDKLADWMRFLA